MRTLGLSFLLIMTTLTAWAQVHHGGGGASIFKTEGADYIGSSAHLLRQFNSQINRCYKVKQKFNTVSDLYMYLVVSSVVQPEVETDCPDSGPALSCLKTPEVKAAIKSFVKGQANKKFLAGQVKSEEQADKIFQFLKEFAKE